MPRGRHRHSTSLHRLLPPSLVAATSVACAAGAWTVGEPLVIRGLAAGAAVAAVVGSVLMRRWDRSAGKQVAQLTAARTRDEWKTDERLAELETDLEETRQARARLETKLRGKRAELARLRTEHADLLRRYAAAETGRARLLESAAGGSESGAESALAVGAPRMAKALESAMQARAERRVGPEAYRRAADALRDLERNAAAQRVDEAPAAPAAPVTSEAAAEPEAPKVSEAPEVPAVSAEVVPAARPALPAGPLPVRQPSAPAVRRQGGFDFFGNAKGAPEAQPKPSTPSTPVEEQDLADVVGEEALAERVIDLTAHDETEQIDVAELRSAI
ncbi:hypothetical protein [Streptomyces luteireticuli]|uniref:Secreted protein n=1 Tax=Streptomyces luteireticuli TaxID=173858 RepID=A0ABN0Y6T1_9ACTN